METAYRETTARRSAARPKGKKVGLGAREKRRLLQLGACLILFVGVFFAKGTDRLAALRIDLSAAISADTDFETVFANLGYSITSGQSVTETVARLWTDVFSPQAPAALGDPADAPLYQATLAALRQPTDTPVHRLAGLESTTAAALPMERSAAAAKPAPAAATEPDVVHIDYAGAALPDNATMDKYALGLTNTVTPAMGKLTSEFGWREHPIEGGEKFHNGGDQAVDSGTAVGAFADGTVDYIGESPVYGKYLQITHANGVTSFYAHCSKLCVQQGQTVTAGEKVAESGATGEVTGPHLHLELKKDGVRLNPIYYIQVAQ